MRLEATNRLPMQMHGYRWRATRPGRRSRGGRSLEKHSILLSALEKVILVCKVSTSRVVAMHDDLDKLSKFRKYFLPASQPLIRLILLDCKVEAFASSRVFAKEANEWMDYSNHLQTLRGVFSAVSTQESKYVRSFSKEKRNPGIRAQLKYVWPDSSSTVKTTL